MVPGHNSKMESPAEYTDRPGGEGGDRVVADHDSKMTPPTGVLTWRTLIVSEGAVTALMTLGP